MRSKFCLMVKYPTAIKIPLFKLCGRNFGLGEEALRITFGPETLLGVIAGGKRSCIKVTEKKLA